VRWLFPGKTLRIDAPCLDGGEPLSQVSTVLPIAQQVTV
jgi:hypothetical protein